MPISQGLSFIHPRPCAKLERMALFHTITNKASMFTRLDRTFYRPSKPLLLWDGDCGFCRYWIIKLKKQLPGKVATQPYQEVVMDIPDVPEWAFREALRLVETDGRIYNGPEAIYKALTYNAKWTFLFRKYRFSHFFNYMSDHIYDFIAKHRNSMFALSKLLFGRNP
jgi:predicted DCC family thiol-disulfide oxidoreductase YuxK